MSQSTNTTIGPKQIQYVIPLKPLDVYAPESRLIHRLRNLIKTCIHSLALLDLRNFTLHLIPPGHRFVLLDLESMKIMPIPDVAGSTGEMLDRDGAMRVL